MEMIVNWLGRRHAFPWINNLLVSELIIFIFEIACTGAVILDVSKLPLLDSWRDEKPASSSQHAWNQAGPTPARCLQDSYMAHRHIKQCSTAATAGLILQRQFAQISHHYFFLFSLFGSLVALHRYSTKISSKNVNEQRLQFIVGQ